LEFKVVRVLRVEMLAGRKTALKTEH
jgi:hypothetical protein